jgi:hypothetical protein
MDKAKQYKKEWKERNKEKIKQQSKEYYLKNKDKIKQYLIEKKEHRSKICKEYYLKNKDKILEDHKKNYLKNKDKILEQRKKYGEKNKSNIQKRRRERYKTNHKNFKISTSIRTSFRKSIKIYLKSKKTKTLKQYGIDIKSIVEHLGNPPQDGKQYHVDHIFPVSAFDLNNPEHIKLCWHPDNLQWLEASENMSKNNKYDEENFKKYLNEKIVCIS